MDKELMAKVEDWGRRLDNLVGDMSNVVNGTDDVRDEVREKLDNIAEQLCAAYHQLEELQDNA